jgi:adenosylmethionine---8-amino-7-oxononanoate aminotransferase
LSLQQTKTLTDRDAAVIWHPYTQHKTMPAPVPVVKGEGVYLIDEKGNRYIDAISSWWTNLHGHAHPYIAEKIFEQARQLEHVIFAGCTHEPAVRLAERLLPLLPGNFSKVFYSDNGSTAVEVALKMALQLQRNKAQESRHKVQGTKHKVLALRNSYHGDTFGAMSVSERGVFTKAFEDYLFEVIFIDLPPAAGSNKHIMDQTRAIGSRPDSYRVPTHDLSEIACFIYEPLVQGAGGMNMYDTASLNELICHLKQHDIICIADEVMTGFGRTGNLFASEYLHHKPDIICLSKGLTGGTLPLAITACSQTIFDAFLDDDLYKTFFHGHSYTANPIACAAALASLDLLEKEECLASIDLITSLNKAFVARLQQQDKAINPRSLGTILAFEFHSDKKEYLSKVKEETMKLALEQGVFLRPLGNTLYSMPPYCITDVELEKIFSVMERIV